MQIKNKYIWNEAKDYINITLGLTLFTIGWTIFLLPYRIVTGGVAGISAILYYAVKIPISVSYFIINLVLILLALKILGWKFMVKTIYAIFVLSFFLGVGQDLITRPDGSLIQLLGKGNDFMSLVIGCICTGTSMAIIFLNNGSTGGTDIIAAIVNKYRNMSLGRVIMFIDILIIGSSLPVFGEKYDFNTGLRMMVFGLCTMAIETFVLDYVMNARRESVQFMIFSRKYQEIANAIAIKTGHSLTILDGTGWYSGKPSKVICLLARKSESVNIFRLIKIIDPRAFVSQSAVIGVYGEGFDTIKVQVKKRHVEEHNPEVVDDIHKDKLNNK